MGIIYHYIQKNGHLPPPPPEAWYGNGQQILHGFPVEVAHHILDLLHQGGNSVMRGFIYMFTQKCPTQNSPDQSSLGSWADRSSSPTPLACSPSFIIRQWAFLSILSLICSFQHIKATEGLCVTEIWHQSPPPPPAECGEEIFSFPNSKGFSKVSPINSNSHWLLFIHNCYDKWGPYVYIFLYHTG